MESGGKVIIAMKGQPGTGKSTLAHSMAKIFKSPVININHLHLISINEDSSFSAACEIASTQLGLDLKVIIDSPLSSRTHLDMLLNLSTSTAAPLVVVDCKPQDKYEWDIRSRNNRYGTPLTWQDYEDKDAAKIIVDTTSYVKDLELCRAVDYIAALGGTDSFDFGDWVGDGFKSKDGNRERGKVSQSFHIHNFRLSNENKVGFSCEACLESISEPEIQAEAYSYYICDGCNLSIHIKCAESAPMDAPPSPLPDLHEYSFAGKHMCKAHKKDTFECQTCLLQTNIRCGLLPSILHHKYHEHPLRIRLYPRRINFGFQCQACGDLGRHALYNCSDCGFQCHINCALKPHTLETVHHRHRLTFTSLSRDGDTDSICDICENARNPNYWTYRCPDPDCDITCHLNCKTPYGS